MWLTKSYLTEPKERTIVLFVEPEYSCLLQNMEYISKIYPLVKQMYPDVLSLHVTTSSLMDYAKSKILDFEIMNLNEE